MQSVYNQLKLNVVAANQSQLPITITDQQILSLQLYYFAREISPTPKNK